MARIIPSKKIREEFSLIYNLKGAQKSINFLSKYYKVKKMKIIVDGRKVPRKSLAYYLDNEAYFKKRGLKKKVVLHEFYHHLVFNNIISSKREEWEADNYSKKMNRLKKFY